MHDIPSLLRSMHARMYMTPHELQVIDAAASDIERLRELAATTVETTPPTTIILHADRFNDIDRRIAELESRVRLHTHRLTAALQACKDVDRSDQFHPSIQVAFSHLLKGLQSEPEGYGNV